MIHLDLFSGIGGFSYAVDQVWEGAEHIFCDIDPFCQAVIRKHWPGSKIYGDIRGLIADTERKRCSCVGEVGEECRSIQDERCVEAEASKREGWNGQPTICLGASVADTKKQGLEGSVKEPQNKHTGWNGELIADTDSAGFKDRDGEHRRVEASDGERERSPCGCDKLPTVADTRRIAEGNKVDERMAESAGKSSGCDKMENIDLLTGGFPCQPFSHAGKRRGRDDNRYLWPAMLEVIRNTRPRWVIAENVRGILSIEGGLVFEQVCADLEKEGYEVWPFIIPACAVNAPHRRDRVWIVGHLTKHTEQGDGGGKPASEGESKIFEPANKGVSDAPDAEGAGQQGSKLRQGKEQFWGGCGGVPDWSRDWREVALGTCVRRVDDGLPKELDIIGGGKISRAKHRVERLKALGNSIVPQVAIEIMRAIREMERNNTGAKA